jgi:hypothetical protein
MNRKGIKQIFRLYVGMILILSTIQFFPLEEPLIDSASAGSSWMQTTQEDFDTGTPENVTVTPSGNITLSTELQSIQDDFYDESLISYKKNITINTAGDQVELVKFNKTFGGPDYDFCNDGMQTLDGGYIILASFDNSPVSGFDLWLIKLNVTGELEWEKKIGGSDTEHGYEISQTTDGGFIATGWTYSWGGGGENLWLVKIDSMGNEQWNSTFGDDKDNIGSDVEQTLDGGYIITGYTDNTTSSYADLWLIKTNSTGSMQWNKTFGKQDESDYGCSIQQTSDDGYIIGGYTYSYGAGYADVWLIKTDENGNETWNKTFGGDNGDYGYCVKQVSDGGYIISGETESWGAGYNWWPDAWLIKTDENGNETWNRTFDYGEAELGYSTQQTMDGGYIILGQVGSQFDYDSWDVLLIKTNDTGEEEWSNIYGGGYYDAGSRVNQTTDGGYIMFCETESFGPNWINVWILKVNETGEIDFPKGSLTSTNLLTGSAASSVGSFRSITTLPLGTGISVQFSQDNVTWYSSNKVLSEWDVLSNGMNFIDLSMLGWNGTSFYYRMEFTSEYQNIPILHRINFTYSSYVLNGTFVSEPHEAGGDVEWQIISWNVDEPQDTNISFQLRTASSESGLSSEEFVGPDGSPSSNYTSSSTSIWSGHGSDRWIQYKVHFNTTNGSVTAILHDITILYNCIPGAPSLNFPSHNGWINDTTPNLNWFHNDLDGSQSGFQVYIDDDSLFGSVNYYSGQQLSSDEGWQFPTGTSYTFIPDGHLE